MDPLSLDQDSRQFWENKILPWENARYSKWTRFSPLAWSVQARLRLALQFMHERANPDWRLFEIGCGSGILAQHLQERFPHYVGIDIARNAIERAQERGLGGGYTFARQDIRTASPSPCDLTIFLGVTDWLTPTELAAMMNRLRSPRLLFSFTDAIAVARYNPYRLYRKFSDQPRCKGRSYSEADIRSMVTTHGFSFEKLCAATTLNPGVLVWSSR